MNKWRAFWLVALAVLVSLTAWGSGQDETEAAEVGNVELRLFTYYGEEAMKRAVDYGLEKMKEEMPNVEVELIPGGAEDRAQQVYVWAAAGELPDIVELHVAEIEKLSASGDILMLDDYAEKFGAFDRVNPSARPLMVHSDGHVWSFPRTGNQLALFYYNKNVFEEYGVELPTDFDELVAAVKAFSSNDVIPISFFAKETWPGLQFYDMLVTRNHAGGMKAISTGDASIDDPAFVTAAKRFEELVQAGVVAPGAFSTPYDQALQQFLSGDAAMFVNGAWALKDVGDALGDQAGLLVPYPLHSSGSPSWAMSGGKNAEGHGVAADTEHPDVAAEYVFRWSMYMDEANYLLNGQTANFQKPSYLPEERDVPLNPIQETYAQITPNFESSTAFPWGIDQRLFAILGERVAELMAGAATAEEFIQATGRDLAELEG